MADCPFCRKPIDSLATRCPHCRSEIQLTPFAPVATNFYSAVVAPALGAGLVSFICWGLSPFSGFTLHFVLGGAIDLTLHDYMLAFDTLATIALVAMGLSAFCGWLRHRQESLFLSLLSFATPLIVPPVLIVASQIASIT